MVEFTDKAGRKRAIEFSNSYDPKYINLTQWVDKRDFGQTAQIPKELIPEIIDNLKGLEKC